jgi:hypothetical protein
MWLLFINPWNLFVCGRFFAHFGRLANAGFLSLEMLSGLHFLVAGGLTGASSGFLLGRLKMLGEVSIGWSSALRNLIRLRSPLPELPGETLLESRDVDFGSEGGWWGSEMGPPRVGSLSWM